MRNTGFLSTLALVFVVAGAAVAAGCHASSSETSDDGLSGDDGGGSIVLPSGNTSSINGPAGTGLDTGLPCDVQAVLENRCIACHDGKIQVSMLGYDDLMKTSIVDPTKTLAEEALVRMTSTTSPMPPPPAAPPESDEIQTFQDWVTAGTPRGAACTDAPPIGATDGGTLANGGDAGVVCTSGKTWNNGDDGSADMHPGAACNACHQVKGGPNLRVAGTVFPTAHEPDDCLGSAPPPTLTITITDKMNKTFTMTANSSGNFSTAAKGIAAPYRAQISNGKTTRSMSGSVTSGDCNSCHTEAGANGAPGRIMAP